MLYYTCIALRAAPAATDASCISAAENTKGASGRLLMPRAFNTGQYDAGGFW